MSKAPLTAIRNIIMTEAPVAVVCRSKMVFSCFKSGGFKSKVIIATDSRTVSVPKIKKMNRKTCKTIGLIAGGTLLGGCWFFSWSFNSLNSDFLTEAGDVGVDKEDCFDESVAI